MNLQAKLLRVIQEREITRIGGNEVIKIDIRLIVATHRDLPEEVKNQNFREDLYYRLLGLPVHLPPLRDRGNDIVILARHFLDAFVKDNELSPFRLSADAQEKLLSYPFPGNVRQLKSITELAAVMANGAEITADDISFNSVSKETNFLFEEMSLKDYTFRIIKYYLDKYDNNVLLVANKLDIGKSTIYRYLKEMEEEPV
jgi:DNA-binding NtrC family response regulator